MGDRKPLQDSVISVHVPWSVHSTFITNNPLFHIIPVIHLICAIVPTAVVGGGEPEANVRFAPTIIGVRSAQVAKVK